MECTFYGMEHVSQALLGECGFMRAGAECLRQQHPSARVRRIDLDGSLQLGNRSLGRIGRVVPEQRVAAQVVRVSRWIPRISQQFQ